MAGLISKFNVMIKIFFQTAVFFMLSLGCSKQARNISGMANPENTGVVSADQSAPVTDTTSVPLHINKDFFIQNIMDYEKSEKWDYKGKIPVIVDFYADWCPPCKVSNPILEELAKEYSGQMKIYKVNVDDEQELASVFGIQSIPSFLFIPLEGDPTMAQGIASSAEATKARFKEQISEIFKIKTERL
jgi:thioredoxin